MKLAQLSPVQAAWRKPPLSALEGKAREKAIAEIRGKLIRELGLIGDTNSGVRDELLASVSAVVGRNTKITEAIEAGEFSIVYKAKRHGRDVAVKAVLPTPRRTWLSKEFIQRAGLVRNVTSTSIINIIDVIERGDTRCAIMDYINTPTIGGQLKMDGPFSSQRAAAIISQLVRVAGELHKVDSSELILGLVRPNEVFIDNSGRVRISLIHISSDTLPSCRDRPILLLDPEELTYLTPERYEGEKIGPCSDQYYLGLLGLELIRGSPPIAVETFSKLEQKRAFFDSPRDFFGDLRVTDAAFSFILARMLEKSPENRWPSLDELAQALDQIASFSVPDVIRKKARDDYKASLRGNTDFFHKFYSYLFDAQPEVRAMFAENMDDQYRKIDRAIRTLFSFDPRDEFTSLDSEVERHTALRLRSEHMDAFREAFLRALRTVRPSDEYSQEAWRALLNSALSFMRERVVENSGSN